MELFVCGIVSGRFALGLVLVNKVQCGLDRPTVPWLVIRLL